MTLANYVI